MTNAKAHTTTTTATIPMARALFDTVVAVLSEPPVLLWLPRTALLVALTRLRISATAARKKLLPKRLNETDPSYVFNRARRLPYVILVYLTHPQYLRFIPRMKRLRETKAESLLINFKRAKTCYVIQNKVLKNLNQFMKFENAKNAGLLAEVRIEDMSTLSANYFKCTFMLVPD